MGFLLFWDTSVSLLVSRGIRLLKPKRDSLHCHGFMVHAVTTAHAHQCCIIQSYAKTVSSRMSLTTEIDYSIRHYLRGFGQVR